jgi:predicted small metal-binding protein
LDVCGCDMKKVSCASRAGCCCGWNSASKFQNELSTKLFVGISSKPMEKKISRNSLRTCEGEPSAWSQLSSVRTHARIQPTSVQQQPGYAESPN